RTVGAPEIFSLDRRSVLREQPRAAFAQERLAMRGVVRDEVALRPDLERSRARIVLVHVRGELPPFAFVVLDHEELLVPGEDRQLLERVERRSLVSKRELDL